MKILRVDNVKTEVLPIIAGLKEAYNIHFKSVQITSAWNYKIGHFGNSIHPEVILISDFIKLKRNTQKYPQFQLHK